MLHYRDHGTMYFANAEISTMFMRMKMGSKHQKWPFSQTESSQKAVVFGPWPKINKIVFLISACRKCEGVPIYENRQQDI